MKTRNTLKRAFKSKRDEYNELARQNLEAEREVIAVIETEEKRLDELVEKAELMKLKKDNIQAMKDKDSIKKGVLSLVISAIALAEKEEKRESPSKK